MQKALIIALILITQPAAAQDFEEALYTNCKELGWTEKAWRCAKLTTGIRDQLEQMRKAEALARQSQDDLERKAYEAEAAARKAGAEHLKNEWRKLKQ